MCARPGRQSDLSKSLQNHHLHPTIKLPAQYHSKLPSPFHDPTFKLCSPYLPDTYPSNNPSSTSSSLPDQQNPTTSTIEYCGCTLQNAAPLASLTQEVLIDVHYTSLPPSIYTAILSRRLQAYFNAPYSEGGPVCITTDEGEMVMAELVGFVTHGVRVEEGEVRLERENSRCWILRDAQGRFWEVMGCGHMWCHGGEKELAERVGRCFIDEY